jgi:hypothetical protein
MVPENLWFRREREQTAETNCIVWNYSNKITLATHTIIQFQTYSSISLLIPATSVEMVHESKYSKLSWNPSNNTIPIVKTSSNTYHVTSKPFHSTCTRRRSFSTHTSFTTYCWTTAASHIHASTSDNIGVVECVSQWWLILAPLPIQHPPRACLQVAQSMG